MRRLEPAARALVLILAVSLSAGFISSGCGGKSSGESGYSGTVNASGSTTVLPLALEAATEFMDANPRANVQVQGGGSSVGIAQLKQRIVQIALSSRELQPGENDGTFVDFRIAFDIIVIIVHPSVPINNLSYDAVKGIFTGKITNWKALGGPDRKIVVVVRDQASGTREVFDEKALGSTKEEPVESVDSAIELNSNGVVRETIAATRYSIGYLSYGYVDERVRPVSINGVAPTVENSSSGRYPIARYLHMFTRGQPSGAAKGYIDFVLSDQFQNGPVRREYIPVKKVQKR